MTDSGILRRKSEHLRIVAGSDVAHGGTTLLEDVHLLHDAIPEVDVADVDLATPFFGKTLSAPLMVTSMTGGVELAGKLNHGLASVCGRIGIAFALGSQRVMFEHPETVADFTVREQIGPDGVLLGNIGAVQLLEVPTDKVADLVRSIDADGLCVHLNAAQELVQYDGNREFAGILDALKRLLDALEGRVLVKETGAGLSPGALEKLRQAGVPYIDVSGSGGTSWTKVESHRKVNGELRRTGEVLADWGVPTAFSIVAARRILADETVVIASGGIRNGLDAARALALGASIVGVARMVLLPFLTDGEKGAERFLRAVLNELTTSMVLTGCLKPGQLRTAPKVIDGRLAAWLAAHGWMERNNP
ncbi:MAG: type 2 isopentenyl-diphosphate Delta-isomerase [bacterium]